MFLATSPGVLAGASVCLNLSPCQELRYAFFKPREGIGLALASDSADLQSRQVAPVKITKTRRVPSKHNETILLF